MDSFAEARESTFSQATLAGIQPAEATLFDPLWIGNGHASRTSAAVLKDINGPTKAAANQLESFLCHVPNEQCLLIAPCDLKPQAGLSGLLFDFHIRQGLTPMRYRQPNAGKSDLLTLTSKPTLFRLFAACRGVVGWRRMLLLIKFELGKQSFLT
jgi:hypothetical protein